MANSSLPDFPFFEVDRASAAFGCDADKYLSRSEGSRVARLLPDEAQAFTTLFFRGGKLSDFGLRWKPEYADKAFATLRGLMASFAPSHEAKEGTVALALHHWCERIPADEVEQAA